MGSSEPPSKARSASPPHARTARFASPSPNTSAPAWTVSWPSRSRPPACSRPRKRRSASRRKSSKCPPPTEAAAGVGQSSESLCRGIAALSEPVSISIVVAAELRYGAARKGSDRLAATLERVLGAIEIEPLSSPVDALYGRLRRQTEREGVPLGANDVLIAARTFDFAA
jgi:hypothetical protein